jgi:hypothetical protein
VYLIIDELMYYSNNKIKFSDMQIDWVHERITNVEKIIDTILKNNYCIIENTDINYYEIDIKYKKEDLKISI